MSNSVGDLVHFVVPASIAPLEIGGTRHGGVVLVAEDSRCLLALTPTKLNLYPWLQSGAGDAKTKMIGLTWITTTMLRPGHDRCQTTLTMTREEALSMQDKILLHRPVLEALNNQGRCWDLPGKPKTPTPPASPRATPPGSPRMQSLKPRKQFAAADQASQKRESARLAQLTPQSELRQPNAFSSLMQSEPVQLQFLPSKNPLLKGGSGNSSPNISPSPTPIPADIPQERADDNGDMMPLPETFPDNSMPPEKKLTQGSDASEAFASQYISAAFDEGRKALRSQQAQLQAEMDSMKAYSDDIAKCCASLRAATDSIERVVGLTRRVHYDDSVPHRQEELRPELVDDMETNSSKETPKESPQLDFDYHVQMLQTRVLPQARFLKHQAKLKERLTSEHRCIPKPILEFVHGHVFGTICSCMTILFAVSVGIQAEVDITSALTKKDPEKWPDVVVSAFNIWFAFEVGIRMLTDGTIFFFGTEWRWNVLDFFLVLLSILDFLAEGLSIGFFRMLRSIKVIKAVRVVRVFRFFSALRMMVAQVSNSLAALFWSLVFLCLIAYLCAVAFLQAAAIYIWNDTPAEEYMSMIQEMYPNMATTLYTLLASITGGIDWTEAAEVVWEFGYLYGLAFTLFVFVSILGILNVVTSVFVERASNMKTIDRDYAISEELRQIESDLTETVELFRRLDGDDEDSLGTVTLEELLAFLKKPEVIAHFLMLGIDVTDRFYIADILDHDGTGKIHIEKFVRGCVSLRASAKKSDSVAMVNGLKEVKKELKRLEKLLQPSEQHRSTKEAVAI